MGDIQVYGFEAITYHNGWAMAITGATIVFSGLIVLSALISQLHKLVNFLDQRQRGKSSVADAPSAAPEDTAATGAHRFDVDVAISPFRAASATLTEPFSLADLHQAARKLNLPHPHLTIQALCQKDELIHEEDGLFRWR